MENIDFEKEIKKLEEITKKLESKSTTLDESVKLYEEGIEISKKLEKALKDASEKVEKVIESK